MFILIYICVFCYIDTMARMTPTTVRFLRPHTRDVLRCGKGRQHAGSRQSNFITSEYVMLYQVTGHCLYSDDEHDQVPVSPGDVWQRLPDVPHSITCREMCEWYYVAVPAPVLRLLEVGGITTFKQIAFHIGHHRHIIRQFEQVHRRLNDGPRSQLPACMLAMQQLMIELHQLAQSPDNASEQWLNQARQLLSDQPHKRIAAQQVARKLNMRYANFRKRFTDATGISPGQYRIRQRLELAQEQLAGTPQSITQIARTLGYPDVYSFSAQFTRHIGMPPGQYRRQWQWESADA